MKARPMAIKIIGAAAGALLGYFYYKKVGCATGTCPITSKPLNSMLYGAVIGFMIATAL